MPITAVSVGTALRARSGSGCSSRRQRQISDSPESEHFPCGCEGVLLAVVATFASLVPCGRLGFREAGVAGAAGAIGGIDPGLRDQLSLLDSAAEAAAYVPLGLALSVLWLRPHFKQVQSKTC